MIPIDPHIIFGILACLRILSTPEKKAIDRAMVWIYRHHMTSIDNDTFFRIPGSTRIGERPKKKL
jgi:hypothetical protein